MNDQKENSNTHPRMSIWKRQKKKKKVQMRCFSFGRFVDFDVKITW